VKPGSKAGRDTLSGGLFGGRRLERGGSVERDKPRARHYRAGMTRSKVVVASALLVLVQRGLAHGSEAGHVVIGDALPELTLSRLDGRLFALSELRGRVAVVAFYSPVCEPCHRMLPDLVSVVRHVRAAAGKGGGPAFVVISLDGVPSRDTVTRTGPDVIWLVDRGGDADERFDPQIRPCTYLVDSVGTVRHINRGYGNGYAARVTRWLRELMAVGAPASPPAAPGPARAG
jgi:thiol-disulfide isomerase/thioredoxin